MGCISDLSPDRASVLTSFVCPTPPFPAKTNNSLLWLLQPLSLTISMSSSLMTK